MAVTAKSHWCFGKLFRYNGKFRTVSGVPKRGSFMNHRRSLSGKGLLFLLFIWFIWFTNYCGRTMFAPVLPLIEDEFRVTHAKASGIVTLIFVGYAVVLLLSGVLAKAFGTKKTLAGSFILLAAVFACMPFVTTFKTLYLLAFGVGIGTGVYLPAIVPMITRYYDERVWGRAIAIQDSAAPMGVFVTPFIASSLLSFVPWRGLFVFVAAANIVLTAILLYAAPDVRPAGQGRSIQMGLLRKKTLWLNGVMWIFVSGASLAVYFIMPLYLSKELGLPMGQMSSILGRSRLGAVVVAITAGFFVDRFDLRKVMFTLLVATGILTMLLTIKNVGWITKLLFLQASVAQGFFPAAIVSISRLFSSEERGAATGFIVAFAAVFGLGIIPYLLGMCGDLVGFRVGIFGLGLLTSLSSLLLFLMPEGAQSPVEVGAHD
jgi:MFS transporter, NNP family, nitrate/nitrite transporter